MQAMERNILSCLLGRSPNPRPDKNVRAEHHAGHGGLRVQKDASLPEAASRVNKCASRTPDSAPGFLFFCKQGDKPAERFYRPCS